MPDLPHNKLLARKISDFCRLRVDSVLPPQEGKRIREFLLDLIALSQTPPRKVRGYDWNEIALRCSLDRDALRIARKAIEPALDAIVRNTKPGQSPFCQHPDSSRFRAASATRPSATAARGKPSAAGHIGAKVRSEQQPATNRRKPGTKPRTIEEFPTPLFDDWLDPSTFREALELHMRRHGDSYWHLHRAVVRDDERLDHSTIRHWLQGSKAPRSVASMEVLGRIERRYRLPAGYFKAKLPHQTRSASGHVLDDIAPAERRRLAWHLPDDFNTRPRQEQEEILEWVQRVIIRGSTDYRRFQAAAMKQRYAIRFPGITYGQSDAADDHHRNKYDEQDEDSISFTDPDLRSGVIDAPPVLAMEMAELIRFKTATLTAFGLQRNGVWGEETASQIEALIDRLEGLPRDELIERMCITSSTHPDFLPPECLLHFVRKTKRDNSNRHFELMYKALIARVERAATIPGAVHFVEGKRAITARAAKIIEAVVFAFEVKLTRDRNDYYDGLDYFEINFASAVKLLRSTARTSTMPFSSPTRSATSNWATARSATRLSTSILPIRQKCPRSARSASRTTAADSDERSRWTSSRGSCSCPAQPPRHCTSIPA